MHQKGKTIVKRLAPGSDLYDEITRAAKAENINTGLVTGIGALSEARLGVVDQKTAEYRVIPLTGDLELCSLNGNISLKEGEPFPHIHLVVSDGEGHAYGGHCMEGCVVFVCEPVIEELVGPTLERKKQDECAGLYLWDR